MKNGRTPKPVKDQKLLQKLARNPENLFAKPFRQQYGALCFRQKDGCSEVEILVISSRQSGRWIIPKGWPVKKKMPHESAEIEALEEAGVSGRSNSSAVGCYTYLKELDDGKVVPCVVDVFEIEVTKTDKVFKERGQRVFDWVSPEEAARRVREVELKALLAHFKPTAMGETEAAEEPLTSTNSGPDEAEAPGLVEEVADR
ncbi:NUDIX hydrolase (plasmid) [Ensifer adhaerens]|nr:NUDIX hydrolase [Ensifer adhaerens]MBZ7927058.1 NUDIX hydrolase [Ensifer adhaerens]